MASPGSRRSRRKSVSGKDALPQTPPKVSRSGSALETPDVSRPSAQKSAASEPDLHQKNHIEARGESSDYLGPSTPVHDPALTSPKLSPVTHPSEYNSGSPSESHGQGTSPRSPASTQSASKRSPGQRAITQPPGKRKRSTSRENLSSQLDTIAPFPNLPEIQGGLTNDDGLSNSKSAHIENHDSGEHDESVPLRTPAPTINLPSDMEDPEMEQFTQKPYPHFKPRNDKRSITEITHTVFKKMREVILNKNDEDRGHIYTFRMVGRPGQVKIGRTKNKIRDRQRSIKSCVGRDLELVNDGDLFEVPYHCRVERLIHAELWNHRVEFECDCKMKAKAKLRNYEESECSTMHGEWFNIDEDKAIKVAKRWRKWLRTNPYCDGKIVLGEELRIQYYHGNPERFQKLITDEGEDWNWETFMNISRLRRYWILLEFLLHNKRSVKYTRSRWDNMRIDGKANVLLLIACFSISRLISVLSELLHSYTGIMSNSHLINGVVFGAVAILYAA